MTYTQEQLDAAIDKVEKELTSIVWQSVGDHVPWNDGRFGSISKMALNDYIDSQKRRAKRLLEERKES